MNPFPTTKEREVGEFGLSIATDLAIAGSLGRHPDNPLTRRPVDDYRGVWCNLATLVRNAYGSYATEDQRRLDSQHLIDDVEQDIQAMMPLYQQILPEDRQVVIRLYYNDYSKVSEVLSRARPRTMKTDLQKQTFELQSDAIRALIEGYPEDVAQFQFHLKGNHGKVLLMTHHPVDLLSRKHFQDVALLESHTGKVKTRDKWYTKYGKDDALKRIPFDQAMIQIFGDGNNLLAMAPPKIRRKLLDIAQKKRWTYMTTKEKVLSNVKSSNEIELAMLLTDAYR